MIEAYGYKSQNIDNLHNIDHNTNNFYIYKDLNFLSKLNSKNENLVITFHGALTDSMIGKFDIIFRGNDWLIDNTDIICITDILFSKYKSKFEVNWTLTTNKHPNTDMLYNELFEYIINHKRYKNVIFTGTSAGGFPSLKFGSFFNSIVIISNAQLYIENYFDNKGLKLIKNYIDDDDEVIYKNKMIEEIILQSQPKKIIYYQNTMDIGPIPHNSYSDFLQFKIFIEKNNLNEICVFNDFHSNTRRNWNQHSIQFPNNKKHIDILQEYIKNN